MFIIGGVCNGSQYSLIAKYTLDKWERAGNLQQNRYAHRSILNGDRIFVVGGYGNNERFLQIDFG